MLRDIPPKPDPNPTPAPSPANSPAPGANPAPATAWQVAPPHLPVDGNPTSLGATSEIRPGTPSNTKTHLLAGLALVAAVLAVFSPIFQGELLRWDDPRNFLYNTDYRGLSAENLKWMFTTPYFGHYQPLTWLTFGIDFAIAGLNPRWMHAVSVGFHAFAALCAYVLFQVIARVVLAPTEARTTRTAFICLIGALLFALHPVAAEPVSWLSARGFTACAAFLFLAVAFYLLAHSGPPAKRRRRMVLCWFATLVSLGFREWAVMFPFVFLILDAYPLRRADWEFWKGAEFGRWLKLGLEKIPWLVLLLFFGYMGWVARTQDPFIQSVETHSLLNRILQSFHAIGFYVYKLFLPINLEPYYVSRGYKNLTYLPHLIGIAFFILTSLSAWFLRRRFPGLLTTWLVFLALISPTIWVAQHRFQLAADRYAYILAFPWIALAVFTAWHGLQQRAKTRGPLPRWPALLVPLLFGLLAHLHTRAWVADEPLWEHALRIDPDNAVALQNSSSYLINNMRLDEARPRIAKLRETHDNHAVHELQGHLHMREAGLIQGTSAKAQAERIAKYKEAEASLLTAINSHPAVVEGKVGDYIHGMVHLAYVQGCLGNTEECLGWLELVFKFAPNQPEALYFLGKIQVDQGKFEEGLASYNKAIDVYNVRPEMFRDRALLKYRMAEELTGDDPETVRQRNAYIDDAFTDMADSIQRYSEDPLTFFYRGQWFMNAGKQKEAILDFERSLKLDPTLKAEYQRLGFL